MVDPALVYVGGVTLLFFFWIYGIVAFVRDVKNKLVPAYRQYRREDGADERGEDEPDEERLRELYNS